MQLDKINKYLAAACVVVAMATLALQAIRIAQLERKEKAHNCRIIVWDQSSNKLMEWPSKGATRWGQVEGEPPKRTDGLGYPVVCLEGCEYATSNPVDGDIQVRLGGRWLAWTSMEKECAKLKEKSDQTHTFPNTSGSFEQFKEKGK